MKGSIEELHDLDGQEESLRGKQREWLEARGWKHTCDTPGSYWLFQKKCPDGRTVIVDMKLAQLMEARMIEAAEWAAERRAKKGAK